MAFQQVLPRFFITPHILGHVRFNDGCEADGRTGFLKSPVDAQVIPSEYTCATNDNLLYGEIGQSRALPRLSLAFYDMQTARVKLEKLGYLVFGFGRAGGDESRRSGCGATRASRGGNKFEQIECDIFIPARTTCRSRWLIHEQPSVAMLPKFESA